MLGSQGSALNPTTLALLRANLSLSEVEPVLAAMVELKAQLGAILVPEAVAGADVHHVAVVILRNIERIRTEPAKRCRQAVRSQPNIVEAAIHVPLAKLSRQVDARQIDVAEVRRGREPHHHRRSDRVTGEWIGWKDNQAVESIGYVKGSGYGQLNQSSFSGPQVQISSREMDVLQTVFRSFEQVGIAEARLVTEAIAESKHRMLTKVIATR